MGAGGIDISRKKYGQRAINQAAAGIVEGGPGSTGGGVQIWSRLGVNDLPGGVNAGLKTDVNGALIQAIALERPLFPIPDAHIIEIRGNLVAAFGQKRTDTLSEPMP